MAGQGGVDDVVGLIGVGTEAGCVGRAAHQLAHDEIADGVLFIADDEDGLAHLDLFQHGVDDQRFNGQTYEGVESGVQVEDEARRHDHEQVGQEEGRRDAVDVGVFFHDEGDDVGAAGGSTHIEQQGRGNGGQGDGEDQVQHGLVGEGAAQGADLFQNHQLRRHDEGGVARGHGKLPAQEDEAHHQQHDVRRRGEGRRRHGGKLCHQRRRTGDAAEDEVVGEFEEVHAHRHDGDAQGDEHVLPRVLHHLFPLGHFRSCFHKLSFPLFNQTIFSCCGYRRTAPARRRCTASSPSCRPPNRRAA